MQHEPPQKTGDELGFTRGKAVLAPQTAPVVLLVLKNLINQIMMVT
jgi:hypothetical protein